MNVAPFVPCSTGGSGGGSTPGASTDAPAGFVDLLASHVTASGDTSGSQDGDDGSDGHTDTSAHDLLMLAALASRTAHAALPLLTPVVATETEVSVDAELADDHDQPALVAAPPVVTTTDTVDGGALDGEHVTEAVASEDGAPLLPTGEPDHQVETAADPVATDTPTAPHEATEPDASVPAEGPADPPQPVEATVAAATTGARPIDVDSQPLSTAPLPEETPRTATTPADAGRQRADAAATSARVDGTGALRVDTVAAAGQPETATSVPSRAEQALPSSAAQRVLDIVSQLEDAPPPRVIVIETGEMRVRVGLDAGTVRMTVLGHVDEAGEEILREAADALEAGGYGTELDRSASDGRGEPRDRDRDQTSRSTTTGPATARSAARARGGLQL